MKIAILTLIGVTVLQIEQASAVAVVSKAERGRRQVPVSDAELKRFKKKNQIAPDAELFIQQVVDDSVVVGDDLVSLKMEDLTPVDMFAAGATVNGQENQGSSSTVYTSKSDPRFTATLNRRGLLLSATRIDTKTGEVLSLTRVGQRQKQIFVTVTNEKLDESMLQKFDTIELIPPGGRRLGHRREAQDNVSDRPAFTGDTENRSLQSIGACDTRGFDIIELAVVVDSFFCQSAGGTEGEAEAEVLAAINAASQFYEIDGLCKKLRISRLDIYCSAGSDPIRPLLNRAGDNDVCDTNNGLLQTFSRYTVEEGISADLNVLVHGKSFAVSTIGCAWVGTLCRQDGFNSGVNEVTFSDSTGTRAQLLGKYFCGAVQIPR